MRNYKDESNVRGGKEDATTEEKLSDAMEKRDGKQKSNVRLTDASIV